MEGRRFRRRGKAGDVKALVTGATGFLGSHLVARLRRDGHPVRALARESSDTARLEEHGCEVVYGDLRDRDSLEPAVRGVEVVFHAGAATSGDWKTYEDTTVRGTRRMLELSRAAGVERFVHISSLAVYRTADLPENAVIDETREFEPEPTRVGNYCRSKVAAERVVSRYQREGLPVVVLRPGLIFGPRGEVFWPNIGYIWRRTCFIIGNPRGRVPLTYVANSVDAILRAARAAGAAGRAYNVVDGPGLTKLEYVRRYRRATGRDIRVVAVPRRLLEVPLLAADALSKGGVPVPAPTRYGLRSKYKGLRCDASRARGELGWVPEVSLEDGLERTFSWWRETRDASATGPNSARNRPDGRADRRPR